MASWRSLERSAIFGRPPPAPPVTATSESVERTRPLAEGSGTDHQRVDSGHRSNPFQIGDSPGQTPRLPEADRRDDAKPLASALLRELKRRRADRAVSATDTTVPVSAEGAGSPVSNQGEEDEQWLDETVIDEAADAAGDFLADQSPPDSVQLPPLPPPRPPVDGDTGSADETPESPEDSQDAVETQRSEPSLIMALDEDARRELAARHGGDSASTYRLRIGGRVYGDIDFEGLLELFRRGVWIVADEIAEDDGPWMPIESHPIFDRLRHAIADGLTNLLLAHGTLLDERPADMAPKTSPATPQISVTAADATRETQSEEHIPTVQAASPTLPWTIALITTGVASAAVTFALLSEPSPPETVDERAQAVATEAQDQKERNTANRVLQRQKIEQTRQKAVSLVGMAASPTNSDLIENALSRGEFAEARSLAAIAYGDSEDREKLTALFGDAVADDPSLRRQLRTIEPDREADAIRALGGGASVTLRLVSGETTRYAYKVERNEWEEGWRVEVAAYKLCQILPCDLYVPKNEPARISRADFEELYGRIDTPRQNSYAAERFDELIWHDEQGPDGVEREYLYGTLKEWIPRYTNWPIEYDETWAPWLSIDGGEAIYEESFDDYLARLDELYDRRFTRGLRRESQDRSPRELARQLSNLHVFDYLTSNFDRYSGIEAYYGVNAHFADGRFVPIDNSAAFQFVSRSVMDRRLAGIERFDRHLVDAIRMLDPEIIDPILFPDAGSRDKRRLEIFWAQREKLLTHVDDLIDEYGEEAVFSLD